MIFPRLLLLDLSNNQLTGLLPEEWGKDGAWPVLKQLAMGWNNLTGIIPDSWVDDFVSFWCLHLLEWGSLKVPALVKNLKSHLEVEG